LLWLEDRLRPAAAPSWKRDSLGVGLLLVVFIAMVSSWGGNLGSPTPAQPPQTVQHIDAGQVQYLVNVPGQMASIYLLLALGFALALRCGAVDLSIWAAAGAGGVVAASLINAGVGAAWSFAASCGAGLALGAFNGAMVGLLRLPSVLVTPVAGAGVLWLMQSSVDPKGVAVSAEAFRGLAILPYPPMLAGRMLVVAGAYSLVMVVMVILDTAAGRGVRLGRRTELFAALAASGALSGLAGACWLIDCNQAPFPSAVIGDLRAPAAAVLAGAIYFSGRSRTLLTGIALPPALLAATIWRQQAWLVSSLSPAWNMTLLMVAVLTVQLLLGRLFATRRPAKSHAAGA